MQSLQTIYGGCLTAWLAVAAYLLTAAATFWASRRASGRDRRFWIGAALLLLLLGLNKELDFQSVLTGGGRMLARHADWYDQRRLIQGIFLLILSVGALAGAVALATSLRRSAMPVKSAAIGVGLLLAFVVIRAASFHHIDEWVTIDLAGMRSGWWLELAGVAVIAISAVVYVTQSRSR